MRHRVDVGSTRPELRVDVCTNCHPFFTGKQNIIDTAGQVERFQKRLERRPSGLPTPATTRAIAVATDVPDRPATGARRASVRARAASPLADLLTGLANCVAGRALAGRCRMLTPTAARRSWKAS